MAGRNSPAKSSSVWGTTVELLLYLKELVSVQLTTFQKAESFSHVPLWESSGAAFLGHTAHSQMNESDVGGVINCQTVEVYGGSDASGLQKRKMAGVHKT